jgi:putative ABC transport system ATP-binding protein
MEPVITVRNVSHYYGSGKLRKQILYDLSAEILSGEIVILTGPSGSGKTTLLTLVGALRSVEEGSLRTLNEELRGAVTETMVRVRMSIGFIFQSHNLLDSLTALQNVQTAVALDAAVSRREARERSTDALSSVGLADYCHSFPSQMSGGQRQRVAIARALVRRPKIVLADEPTAALDRKSGREVVDLLHDLAERQGCAILLVTHDNRILDIADRILTLEDGRISSQAS